MHATLLNELLTSGSAASVAIVTDREEGQEVAKGRNPDLVNRRVRAAYDMHGGYYESRSAGAVVMTSHDQLPR
jgi:hypothetical protein